MSIDYASAFAKYNARFDEALGAKPVGAYAKFGKHMIRRLDRAELEARVERYVQLHKACARMLDGGSTISDALVLEFQEAAAWVCIEAPDLYAMFRGEMGDPRVAAPSADQ